MPKHNTLILETGARGHVIAELVRRSPDTGLLYHYPSKVLAEEEGITVPTGLRSLTELGGWDGAKSALADFAVAKNVKRVLVTADDPIAAGVGDVFRERGIQTFSPTAEAATIESSKKKMKHIARERGVPTADFEDFDVTDADETMAAVIEHAAERNKWPVVVKADGLAAGKGVKICASHEELYLKLEELRAEKHLEPGKSIVVEEYLEGPEISLHAWVGGDSHLMFPFAMQDHKTIRDNNEGPMTGGMGVVLPMPHLTAQDMDNLGKIFINPFVQALKDEGTPFHGVMYPGIKLTANGPKLLEVNCRPGDPEAPAAFPMLESDFMTIAMACAEGKLNELPTPRWRKGAAVCIALAAPGYPGKAQTGGIITGIEQVRSHKGVRLYDYALKREKTAKGSVFKTNGGRVLGVHAAAANIRLAVQVADKAAAEIRFDGKEPQRRRDIGAQAGSELFKERVEILRSYLAAA